MTTDDAILDAAIRHSWVAPDLSIQYGGLPVLLRYKCVILAEAIFDE